MFNKKFTSPVKFHLSFQKFSKPVRIALYTLIAAICWAILYYLNKSKIIDSYFMQLIMLVGINIMMTVSLNLLNGYTGLFSLGHAGFMGIGAYVSAGLTTLVFPPESMPAYLHIPFFILALLAGGIAAGIAGYLIGLPCLRLKGDYLAIVTLAFGEIVRAILRVLMFVGGPRGLTGIPNYTSFTILFIFTFLTIMFIRSLVNSSFGRAFLSIQENEIAAETMGINATNYKMLSFVIASVIAGIAGGLFAHLLVFINPDQFSMVKSTDYLVFLYAGGVGSISGSILGATLLTILPELLRFLSNWRIVIYSVLLVFIMLRRTNGLYGNKEFPFLRVKNTNV